jgi:hypothetical protein
VRSIFRYILISTVSVFCLAFISGSGKTLYVLKQHLNLFASDNLNNSYVVNGEELTKYTSAGKLFLKYSNKRYGNITTIDATNALKVLLYYKDFQQLVFLDSQLSQNGDVISLETLGYEQTDLVCTSFNNSFWIYDKQAVELVRFNENSQQVAKTGNLKQLLQAELKPEFMIEHNSYLYLNCPDIGIYVFDMYGTFNRIIGLKNIHAFQVSDNIIYYFNNGKFCSYDAKAYEEKCITYNDSLLKNVRIEKERLFLQYSDSVIVLDNSASR